jgi:predicted MFS family arabinose efflux permease
MGAPASAFTGTTAGGGSPQAASSTVTVALRAAEMRRARFIARGYTTPAMQENGEASNAQAASRPLLLLLAVAAGLAAANLYYGQPLAAAIGESLRAPAAAIGTALTATQVGYALGMILLVPLGDARERRSLVVTTLACSVPALLLVAASPSVSGLIASSLLVGASSSVVQMIVPYAVDLAPVEQRGRVVGTVMSGLFAGILLSRTASGALGAAFGWRAVYVVAAVVMAALGLLLRLVMPAREPAERLAYRDVLRSLGTVVKTQPVLRRRAVIGALGFASFSVFWSMLSYHLKDLGHGSATAGLFGAIGIVGVVVAPLVGGLATGPRPSRINVAALLVAALSFAVFFLGASSLVAVGVGVVLLDLGVQANLLTNQTVIYGLNPELRSRLNAVYMVVYFVGGAGGTVAGALAWSAGGWPAVCATGALLALAGMLPLLGGKADVRGRSPAP